MRNIKLVLEYLGTNYCGFQKQKNGITIQESLEEAIFKATNQKVTTYPSGRTDAGVHALAQVVNFFTTSSIPAEKFKIVINFYLPKDIKVVDSSEVDLAFNSRKSAISKTYIYKIYNKQTLSVFDENRCLAFGFKCDLNLMNEGAKLLIGEHDFSSFASSKRTSKTSCRTIFDCSFKKENDYIIFTISGNGFLYNMVRIIVGTLLDLGTNKIDFNTFKKLLSEPNSRKFAGKTVSPNGLYLKEVKYN